MTQGHRISFIQGQVLLATNKCCADGQFLGCFPPAWYGLEVGLPFDLKAKPPGESSALSCHFATFRNVVLCVLWNLASVTIHQVSQAGSWSSHSSFTTTHGIPIIVSCRATRPLSVSNRQASEFEHLLLLPKQVYFCPSDCGPAGRHRPWSCQI